MPGKILIVDAIATNRILLTGELQASCHRTLQATGAEEALALARRYQPGLVLLDLNLPQEGALTLCEALRRDPDCRAVPIVMTVDCAPEDLPALRLAALRAGAEDLLPKPLDIAALLARFRSLVRLRNAEEEMRLREDTSRELGFAEPSEDFGIGARIALIGTAEDRIARWQAAVAPLDGVRCSQMSQKAAISRGELTDLFLIDATGPGEGLQGLNLMSDLRSRSASRHAAVLMVLPERDARATMALDLGAADLIPDTATPEEIRLRVLRALTRKALGDRLRHALQDGLRLAASDPLTGLFNRRYALPHLARIAEECQREGRSFAVMALDIDRFKRVNDQWGHAAGDCVLIEVAQRLRENLRGRDLLARIGGEEFLIALPDANLPEARRAAERLRQVIEERPLKLPEDQGDVAITVSIGLAIGRPGPIGPNSAPQGNGEAAMQRADRALLAAKSRGRNQVTVSRSAA